MGSYPAGPGMLPAPARLASRTAQIPARAAAMALVLIAGILLIVLALLGFGGVHPALRPLAWPMLGLAAALIALAVIF